MVGEWRVNRDLGRCAAGKVVGRHILINVNEGDGATSLDVSAHVLQRAGCLQLSGSDRIEHVFDLAFEDLAGDAVECNLGFISGPDALKRILLEAGSELLIIFVHEYHHGAERRGNDVHARSKHHLGDVTGAGCPHDGSIEIELGVA